MQGWLITRLRLPSFVVTLAGLLGWQGVLLVLINKAGGSSGGTIAITNNVIFGIVNANMSPVAGWIVLAACVLVFAVLTLLGQRNRRRSGLAAAPFSLAVAKIALFAVAGVILVAVCNANRGVGLNVLSGVPYVVPIVLAILLAWTVLLGRTRFGRYVYAIGGNAEAARRAGINVSRIRLACFVLCSLTGGMGGIVYASRLGSMSNNVNGGQLVLFAVAAAVIGGTSLFGGRGKMLHALLGGMIIATIANGMGLIGLDAPSQLIVTALVLLAAVIVDAVTRRGQTATASPCCQAGDRLGPITRLTTRCQRRSASQVLVRLAPAVTARMATMITSDVAIPTSGTGMGPMLLTCDPCRASNTSLNPMNAKITDSPMFRYTSRSSSPPIRKYSWRRPISAKALAVSTM
jgi:D-xylose transport system permease protein